MNPSCRLVVIVAAVYLAIPLALGTAVQAKPKPSAPQGKTQKQQPKRHSAGYSGSIVAKGAAAGAVKAQLDPNSRIMAPLRMLPGGTKVKVVKSDLEGARIEVIAGPLKGKQYWIHWSDLR